MLKILSKEINQFFSSVTGYLAIIVFMVLTGLIVFVFPETSVLDYGYASMEPFFEAAPWVLLFLIPAITMRLLAEEQSAGTLELLGTKPISPFAIFGGKYLAAFLLVLFALLPTLLYPWIISRLAEPAGNIDIGAIAGSFVGLAALAACFTAIGLFASALSKNQVVAFIVAVLLCFVCYYAFTSLSNTPIFVGKSDYFIQQLGLESHYIALSRGVIDSRDIFYFITITLIFLALTAFTMKRKQLSAGFGGPKQWLPILIALGVSMLINFSSSSLFRFDLTEEKRYTISESTKDILRNVNEPVDIYVFLQNQNLSADFKRLQKSTRDLMQTFKRTSRGQVQFTFEDPLKGLGPQERQQTLIDLQQRGVVATNARIKTKDGFTENLIFPGALINSERGQIPVNFLLGGGGRDALERSIELLEYNFANAVNKVTGSDYPEVAFIQGHGELNALQTNELSKALAQNYIRPKQLDLPSIDTIPSATDLVIIAKPTKAFSEADKFKIDQYVMNGGKALWMVDMMKMKLDSLQQRWGGSNVAVDFELNLDDILFKYGVRINRNLVRDLQSKPIPIVIDENGQTELLPWTFFPLSAGKNDHITVKNITPVSLEFVSGIDTLRNPNLEKTVLLSSSVNSGLVANPVLVDLEELRNPPPNAAFALQNIPVAVLLEGRFSSVFENRPTPVEDWSTPRKNSSLTTQQVVIADGDLAANPVLPDGQTLPLGYDRSLRETFGNQEFLLNVIEYMVNERNALEARNKEVKLRLLNRTKVEEEKSQWQFTAIGLPIIFFAMFGFLYNFIRRRRFT
ncbi:MAG: gliding motility-associated ABC transporter substrate-binding protein GldG [Saprospiraceae bacterium]|nr:gliding motility-associated ABC transporter substrate-binding protein GldG [Saprospiraceae bacterium]